MTKVAASNFQDQWKWFQKDCLSLRDSAPARSIPPQQMEYSFPSSVELLQPMIQMGSFSMEEIGKFAQGKQRSINFPVKVFQPLPEPPPRKPAQVETKPENTSSNLANSSYQRFGVPQQMITNNTATTVAHVTTTAAFTSAPFKSTNIIEEEIPDSLLQDIDLDKILEQAGEASKPDISFTRSTKTMSDMLGVNTVTTATFNSYSLATPKPNSYSNSYSEKSTVAYPSVMPPPSCTINNPLAITTSRIVKKCHCNLECEISTISNSTTSRRSYLCRRLICTFMEWLDENVNPGATTAVVTSFATPCISSTQNANNGAYATNTSYQSEFHTNANGSSYVSYNSNSGSKSYTADFDNNSAYNANNQSNFVPNAYPGNGAHNVTNNNGHYDSYQQPQSSYTNANYTDNYSNNYDTNNYNNNNYTNNSYNTNNSFVAKSPSKAIRNPRLEVQKRFGHREFRPGQWDCIEAALQGRDVFCLMPTGGGKSMVYQLPAWCCAGVTVVFSPLISLIQDQVDALNAMGIRAVCLSQSATGQDYETSEGRMLLQELRSYHNYSSSTFTSLSPAEQTRIQQEDEHRIKMLYITPEKFSRSQAVRNLLQQLMHQKLLSRFVLDEAHCLSQWGHDFRPDYLKLADIRQLCPSVPIMALTATANQSVVQDIIKILQMKQPFVHTQSFNRPNLTYKVLQKKGEKNTLDEVANYIVQHMQWTGIIYCLSRRDCEVVVEDIVKLKPQLKGKISFYHADLPIHEKENRQRLWFKGDLRVLCATIAFGMGINKPDVRYVIHLHMPKSLTNYYQESGRAGRDGLAAECILYYSYKDKSRVLSMLDKSQASYDGQQRQLTSLMKCLEFCLDEVTCRRQLILSYFGETFDVNLCKNTCDTCQAMAILRQNFTINGIPLSRLIETHDITHIATLSVHMVMTTTNNEYAQNNANNNGRYGKNRNNNSNWNKLPKLTASKLAKLLSGSKGKEVNAYLSSLSGLKDTLQPLFRDQDIHNIHTQYGKEAMEVICHHLIIDGYLKEEHVVTNVQGNYGADYLILGPKAKELLENHAPKARVFIKFRGQMPTNGYGPNTGITNSIAAKSNKKNSSKSSHSNIVQANGQLGNSYVQDYLDEILTSEHEDMGDEDDNFAPVEVMGHDDRPTSNKNITKMASNPSYINDTNAYNSIDNGIVNPRKRKPSVSIMEEKTTTSNKNDPYAYLNDTSDDEAFSRNKRTLKNSNASMKNKTVNINQDENIHSNDDDDWGDDDSEDSAYPRKQQQQVNKKARLSSPSNRNNADNINNGDKKKKPITALGTDEVVDLLEDSQAEEVTLDAAHVAAHAQRHRAAQQAQLLHMKQERQKMRLLQKQQQQLSSLSSAAVVMKSDPPTTMSKSNGSLSYDDDYEDENHPYQGNKDHDDDDDDDVEFSNTSVNKSTLSIPGFPTKRVLDFDHAVEENDAEDEAAKFARASGSTSAKKQLIGSVSVNKNKRSLKQFRNFLDAEDDETNDEDEEFDGGDMVTGRDKDSVVDDEEGSDDIADIALHAFPSRSRKTGTAGHSSAQKKAALSFFTSQREKMPFKSPYLSQKERAKQMEKHAELVEQQRLDTIGRNGLTGRQQNALRLWLQAYRRRWANYWHHLSDASLEYIVMETLPQTIAEVADIPGIGESRATRDGPELIATLAAFLLAQQTPETELERLTTLFPVLTGTVPPLGVAEDIIWRDPMSEAAQQKMSGMGTSKTMASSVNNATTSSSNNNNNVDHVSDIPGRTAFLFQPPASTNPHHSLPAANTAATTATVLDAVDDDMMVDDDFQM